ncbi:helix-turn-helix domain-containing protein [Rhodoligotrophos defluvii]|uniref:helix-turn-helix domain-containing protein n=1 Tax=Rhodoligotrophos defluvii TaxID=2561934 RepID=UPI0010C996B2|nr:helix-turn-helix transcriptional regulator [Rhodoligotrophos defluvii]
MGVVGENIKRLRRAANMSQMELAQKSGLTQQMISHLETGRNETTKELPALASALGVRVHEIDPNYSPPTQLLDEQLAEVFQRLSTAPEEIKRRLISYANFELSQIRMAPEDETEPGRESGSRG